jgi:hypothetical protein
MNSEHLDEAVLQQMAIYKTDLPLNAMEHYKACVTCQHTVRKYTSMLEKLGQEKHPELSATAKQIILAGLPAFPMARKNYGLIILISAGILVCLGLLFILMSEYLRQLPAIASVAALVVVAAIVIQEFIERYQRFRQQLDELSIHHRSSLTSLK